MMLLSMDRDEVHMVLQQNKKVEKSGEDYLYTWYGNYRSYKWDNIVSIHYALVCMLARILTCCVMQEQKERIM